MGGVEHHQPRELAGRRGADDLSAKATLAQKGQTPAMIKVSMSEQDIVDSCRVETELSGVLLGELTTALKQSAINEDPFACAFHQMAGSSHVAIGAVKY